MTQIKLIIIFLLVAIIAVIAVPRAIKTSKLTKAEHFALAIASAFRQYQLDTGRECLEINALLNDNNVSGWLGPYISAKVLRNPWGGAFAVDSKNKRIIIPVGDSAPDQYELGGSEEISFGYENPE